MRLTISFILFILSALPFGVSLLTAQLDGQVDLIRQEYDSAFVIAIRWSPEEEQQWHMDNDGRLEIPAIKTNINSQQLKKAVSGVTTYSFDVNSSALVELMVHIRQMDVDEDLYLWDMKRDRIIFDLAQHSVKSVLTPAFDPSTTLLVWKSGEGSTYTSAFSIDHIYYQSIAEGRSLDIGFGTALSCHPNAVCKQDSLMKLISNSAVRIRLVMAEGIGWCSGSFVNNTRNDKTPYLLTAFHCQYDFTPLYDMWRFDFQYTSPTCNNPATEPSYFSHTGCSLVSAGQASDFLLVLLDEDVPFNQEVTFAGWNRDETVTPDTSYLIHHPNADIRKISTSVNDATIHPNQIGWIEGYTTPANHHFRLKFTEGGHESGSSGGPLFNEKGFLVGQLHGGTAGCEIANNAFIGRLARSWNPGTTPQERLSDWLDPDQTGVTSLPSIENKSIGDLVDIHGLLLNPAGVPIKNATINVTGAIEETFLTTEDGTFVLSGVSRNGQYIITPEKTDNPSNGLNALDLIAIQKHLLGKVFFEHPWQFIAADATNNDDLSVGDIVLLLRLLLGKIQALPSNPSWQFDPPYLMLDTFPPGEPVEIQFLGIKIGDVNGTADPKL